MSIRIGKLSGSQSCVAKAKISSILLPSLHHFVSQVGVPVAICIFGLGHELHKLIDKGWPRLAELNGALPGNRFASQNAQRIG